MVSINHSSLRAFHAVATEGSFTKAARALNVTQPTLSGQVKALEEQFGVRLFDRRKRKIELTDIGRNLLDITWRMFGLESEAEQVLTAAKGLKRGHLRIGADAPYHSIPFLAAFNRRYPNVRLSMSIGNSLGLKADLIDQRFDVIIAADIGGDPKLYAFPFQEDYLIAFVDRAHPWARKRKLRLEDLAGNRLVLREPASTTRRAFDAAVAKAGIQVGEILEIGSREAIREAVAAGLGIGIVARSEFGDHLKLKGLEFEGPRIKSTEFVACLMERRSNPLVKAFLDIAKEPPGERNAVS
ncbi:LysR family transcriptional regulator [Dongia mobilis]|uniref:LysR family transcriptional regulator n=1 Tax=Dongia mobilis TaxID=578943 RepID=A0A4R6WDH1_9PROT|nr:LysR substrate-binding domain-containing protein [Dongia mobilis]TDQ77707.1 LysR family transcriptional regulator [Dongia mobilis]